MVAKKKAAKRLSPQEKKAAVQRAELQAEGLIRNAVHDALGQSIVKGERVVPLSTGDLYRLMHAVVTDVLFGRQSPKNLTIDSDVLKRASKAAARAIRTAYRRRDNRPDDATPDPFDFPIALAPQTLEPKSAEDQERAGKAIAP
jgi:hypothetical protein